MSTDLQIQKSFKRNRTNILWVSLRLLFTGLILQVLGTQASFAQDKLESKGHIPINRDRARTLGSYFELSG